MLRNVQVKVENNLKLHRIIMKKVNEMIKYNFCATVVIPIHTPIHDIVFTNFRTFIKYDFYYKNNTFCVSFIIIIEY